MYPNKGTLLIKNFQDLVPPLLNLAAENEAKYDPDYCLQFNDCKFKNLNKITNLNSVLEPYLLFTSKTIYNIIVIFLMPTAALNALLILSRFLPKPKRVHGDSWEQNMNPLPLLEDFFHVVPVSSVLVMIKSV